MKGGRFRLPWLDRRRGLIRVASRSWCSRSPLSGRASTKEWRPPAEMVITRQRSGPPVHRQAFIQSTFETPDENKRKTALL